jgi:gamma-glutamylcyclotransferase (GGCT)/AIG2-like uncharacterized protein YtfP
MASVFVYGTLRRGRANCGVIASETTRLVGIARSIDSFPMRVMSRYNVPFLFRKPGHGQRVIGEVYEVDQVVLEKLDQLEGHPHFYRREEIEVEDASGSRQQAQCYLLPESYFDWSIVNAGAGDAIDGFIAEYTDVHAIRYVAPAARPLNFQREIRASLLADEDESDTFLEAPPVSEDWKDFVLLLVDVQNEFWDGEMEEQAPSFRKNVAALLKFCRENGVEVVHVREQFAKDGSGNYNHAY